MHVRKFAIIIVYPNKLIINAAHLDGFYVMNTHTHEPSAIEIENRDKYPR